MTDEPSPPKPGQRGRRPLHEKPAPGPMLPAETALYLELRRIDEIKELIWIPEGMPDAMVSARVAQALDIYQAIAPQDGVEGMLALQMVGTHHAAMECLRRAAMPNQTFEGRDMALKHAHKLMNLYTQQMARLAKHQAQRPRKPPAEEVEVSCDDAAVPTTPAVPLAIEHHREMPIAPAETHEPDPVPGRRRR